MSNRRRPQTPTASASRSLLEETLSGKGALRGQQQAWMNSVDELPEAFDHALRWAAALQEAPRLHRELVHLCARIFDAVAEAVDRILSLPDPHEVEQSRFLLETEFLLLEFAADPPLIDTWAELPEHERMRRFGFGQLRQRAERRQGLPAGEVSAQRDHYRVHSKTSHPYPLKEVMPPAEDPRLGLLSDLVDLLMHAFSSLVAAERAAEESGAGLPAALGQVNRHLIEEVIGRLHAALTSHISADDMAGLQAPRPVTQTAARFWDPPAERNEPNP